MASAEELAAPLSYAEDSDRPTPWHRYISALARYRWLVLACVALGAGAGFVGARFAAPEYEAHATIWISTDEEHAGPQAGPIQAQELLNSTGWDELFRSHRVTDSVVAAAPALSQHAQARLDPLRKLLRREQLPVWGLRAEGRALRRPVHADDGPGGDGRGPRPAR